MCLTTRLKHEVEKEKINALPDGFITVYKRVQMDNGSYVPSIRGGRFRVGLNNAKNTAITLGYCGHRYLAGFHSFKTRRGVRNWGANTRWCPHVKFQIRKEWIVAIGRQDGCICYVTDRIVAPSLKDESAVLPRSS